MFVHGDNLKQKESHKEKYTDQEAKSFLVEIRTMYDKWNIANLNLRTSASLTSKLYTKPSFTSKMQ